eukprot:1160813-Pelagomonas_calceolata.AAC.3
MQTSGSLASCSMSALISLRLTQAVSACLTMEFFLTLPYPQMQEVHMDSPGHRSPWGSKRLQGGNGKASWSSSQSAKWATTGGSKDVCRCLSFNLLTLVAHMNNLGRSAPT